MFAMIKNFYFLGVVGLLLLSCADVQGQTFESVKSLFQISDRPLNCEMTLQLMEEVRNAIRESRNEKSSMILIARLGDEEKSPTLNRRRLYNLREGFQNVLGITKKIVIAEGEKTSGFGRVEVYLDGEFVGAILAMKNKHVIKCDSP